MALTEITVDHFDGGANTTQANKVDSGPTNAELWGKIKTGTITAAGAGTETVAFTTAFASASYTVALSTDTAAGVPIYASKAVGGFDITVAAACDVDWIAILD